MRFVRGQGILEYVALLGVVVCAILIMQVFIKRAYQGKLKQDADSLGSQYSPGHTTSYTYNSTSTNTETYMGGTTLATGLAGQATAVPDGMSVTFSQSSNSSMRKEAVDSFATED